MKNYAPLLFVMVVSMTSLLSCKKNGKSTTSKSATIATYQVSGTLTGQDTGWVYLYELNQEKPTPDSSRIKNGTFQFIGEAATFPSKARLKVGKGRSNTTTLFLEEGNIIVTGNLADSPKFTVKGTATNDEFSDYQSHNEKMTREIIWRSYFFV